MNRIRQFSPGGLVVWLYPLTLALGSLLAAFVIASRPADQGAVAAIFPPWWSGLQSISAAGQAGPVIRFGGLPNIVIVMTERGGAEVLRRAGAWAVLDPLALGGCGGAVAQPVAP
ncbi:MAG TPA: hypothetical protein VL752_10045 [Acidisoma sp.]|uniref:hypothetical protein n=1 Tax=Acidisoma sp. TaxID=1872115 RepID=UPI002BB1CEB2|nr:hypothetical protein [Acidisoma sp.]HTI01272.1 hypothetical protein [Acidisoma sp.]